MDSLLTTMLLFIAAITALLAYLVMPLLPSSSIVFGAAILLAVGVWWHWTQFGVEYRISTWQEQLRNYASYALVLVVILLAYGFYTLAWSGSSLEDIAGQASRAVRNAGRKATSTILGGTTRALSSASNTLFAEPSGGIAPRQNLNSSVLE
jgi:uncharacterized membrane protein